MASDAIRAWEALRHVHAKLVTLVDRELQAATGLPLTWYSVLLELDSADSHLKMTELADRVMLSRTRVSRLVDELVQSHLVSRQQNPDDGRSSFVSLTDEGQRRLGEAMPVYLKAIEREIAGKVSPTELRQLTEVLERIREGSA